MVRAMRMQARTIRRCAAAVMLAGQPCLAAPCLAAPVSVPLSPATTQIGLTVFAAGMWPVPGRFERFRGRLTVDPAVPAGCRVSVEVEVASLHMAGPGRTRLALGSSLLDAARYPNLAYTGSCSANPASGRLTLHGVTGALSLRSERSGDHVSATGSLQRQDFGVTGLPGLVGRRVDLLLTVTLPHGLADQIAWR